MLSPTLPSEGLLSGLLGDWRPERILTRCPGEGPAARAGSTQGWEWPPAHQPTQTAELKQFPPLLPEQPHHCSFSLGISRPRAELSAG